MEGDTIAAIATVPGVGAIGVIRMSGPAAIGIADRVFRGKRRPSEAPGRLVLLGEIAAGDGEAIDQVLLWVMRKPHTLTGEDVVEISCHGGLMAPRLVLRRLAEEGARPAVAGEFTKRAFLNGKIDLTQAEAVSEIVGASSAKALRIAVKQLRGALSARLADVERVLLGWLAHIEASIDFVDDDVEPVDDAELADALDAVSKDLGDLLRAHQDGSHLRDGLDVVIVGKPNVGKSSLFNRLLGKERVIVCDTPGTTRDVVDGLVGIDGVVVRIHDTAGIKEASGEIEREALKRTASTVEAADIALAVLDVSRALSQEDTRVIADVSSKPHLIVANKMDLAEKADLREFGHVVRVSALKGYGIPVLTEHLRDMAHSRTDDPACQIMVSERHAACLRQAADCISRAAAALTDRLPPEFVASDIRLALDSLGEITGSKANSQVLDQIFSRFCIGK